MSENGVTNTHVVLWDALIEHPDKGQEPLRFYAFLRCCSPNGTDNSAVMPVFGPRSHYEKCPNCNEPLLADLWWRP